MEMREGAVLTVAMAILIMAGMQLPFCLATQYTVGDASGWDASTNFNSWLAGKTFVVGDTLLFQYSSFHSLLEVTKADYDSCQTSNSLQSHTDGNTVIKLSSAGNKYFICGTPGHCSGGMKLAVNVGGSSPSTPSKNPPSSSSPAAQAPPTSSTPSGSTPASKSPTDQSAAAACSSFRFKNAGLLILGAAILAGLMM